LYIYIYILLCSCYPIKDGGCQYPLKYGESQCKCKRRYDDVEISNISILENGYPQYRRQKKFDASKRDKKDLRVVSHNREIFNDWKGHTNFEFVGSANVILYLYKYLFKGAKNKKMEIVSSKKEEVNNQVVQLKHYGEYVNFRRILKHHHLYQWLKFVL
jgi:hypothetical protein